MIFDKFDIISTYMHGFSDYEGNVNSMTISQYTNDRRLLKESIFHFNSMQKLVSYKERNTTVNYMYNGPLLQSVSLDLDNNLNSVSCFLVIIMCIMEVNCCKLEQNMVQ